MRNNKKQKNALLMSDSVALGLIFV